jgi:putative ABC transport system ATP-binding protein
VTEAPVAVLELREAVKHYRSGGEVVRAVDGVSLTVGPGEVVALYGPSGSGKTTLLLLAAALLSPDAGGVRFAGRDLATLSEIDAAYYRRREVGLIHQSFHLLAGLTALDNAAAKLLADNVPLHRARELAKPWMKRLGLSARLDHLPTALSGGERQRVAIARALANEPRLLLADEPTGSLDSRRGAEVLRLLAEICHERDVGMVLVTHDPEGAAIADRIHTLRDGQLTRDTAAPTSTRAPDAPAGSG